MTSVREIYSFLEEFAPFSLQESWDNSGLLVESPQAMVNRILCALDITSAVVEEAHTLGAELILSHHPVIFRPLRQLTKDDPAYLLAQYGLSAICAHTNLDLADGGVNDVLAARLQLQDLAPLGDSVAGAPVLGRIGNLPHGGPDEIVFTYIRKVLGADNLRYVSGPAFIRRVAVCGGAGGDLLTEAARLGADLLLTGDIKHDQMLEAKRLGIALVGAGHYHTERVMLEPLAERIRTRFPALDVRVSLCEQNPEQYLYHC